MGDAYNEKTVTSRGDNCNMKQKTFLSGGFQANNQFLLKKLDKVMAKIVDTEVLNLPQDVPDDIQAFYDELGHPFFDSKTKAPILKLAKLQLRIWMLHRKYKKLLVLKSQKIGISSLCILICLWHAFTDCMGMEILITAQSDEQAKTHAQDLRRLILGSDKYRDYLITSEFTQLGLLKDEVTKVHTIYLHNPKNMRLPTKIIVAGMSPGALLSHKRVGLVWSSDMTISGLTSQKMNDVWSAFISRLALTQGPCIVECPARAPAGPVYDTFERYEKEKEMKRRLDPAHDFYVEKFTYQLGIRDGFFTEKFIEAEKRILGPLFGTLYNADFFASENTWYSEEHFANKTEEATDLFMAFHDKDDSLSDLTDD